MSTDRAFSILLVHEECIVASLELENITVQLVRHLVVQRKGLADQKVYNQWQQPEAHNGEDRPDDGVGASPRRVLDDPDEDDGDKDGRTQQDGTEVRDDGVLPEFYK